MSGNAQAVFEVANDSVAVHRPVQGPPNPHVGEVARIAGAVAHDEKFRVEKGRRALGELVTPLGLKAAVGVEPLVLVAGIDTRQKVEFALHKGHKRRLAVGRKRDTHGLEVGQLLPLGVALGIVGVAPQDQFLAALPSFELKGAGTHGVLAKVRAVAGDGLARNHRGVGHAQFAPQRRIRCRQGEDERVGRRGPHRIKGFEQPSSGGCCHGAF